MKPFPTRVLSALQVREPPALIAHAAGNSASLARESFDAGADLIEADIWSYRNRLEARHERRVPPTRVLFERWYLKWAPADHFLLRDLLREARGRGGVLLDFKNFLVDPGAVADAFREQNGDPRICASSQQWSTLRSVRERLPTVEMFYSIDVRDQLNLFLSVIERDNVPSGVSCNHRHLDEALVRRFHDLGLAVIAWTVDDPLRAVELAHWGVDAITTNAVQTVRLALDSR